MESLVDVSAAYLDLGRVRSEAGVRCLLQQLDPPLLVQPPPSHGHDDCLMYSILLGLMNLSLFRRVGIAMSALVCRCVWRHLGDIHNVARGNPFFFGGGARHPFRSNMPALALHVGG